MRLSRCFKNEVGLLPLIAKSVAIQEDLYGKDHPVKCRIWYTQKKIPTMDAIKGPIKSMDKVKAQYSKWLKWRTDEHQRLHNQVSSTKVNQTKKDKFNFNPNKLGL